MWNLYRLVDRRALMLKRVFAPCVLLGASLSLGYGGSLVSLHSSKCLQVVGSPLNGSGVVQATCTGASNQQWIIRPLNINGQYLISFRAQEKDYMLQVDMNQQLVIADHVLATWSYVWDERSREMKNGISFYQLKNESVKAFNDACIGISGDRLGKPEALADGTQAVAEFCDGGTDKFGEISIPLDSSLAASSAVWTDFNGDGQAD